MASPSPLLSLRPFSEPQRLHRSACVLSHSSRPTQEEPSRPGPSRQSALTCTCRQTPGLPNHLQQSAWPQHDSRTSRAGPTVQDASRGAGHSGPAETTEGLCERSSQPSRHECLRGLSPGHPTTRTHALSHAADPSRCASSDAVHSSG